MYRKPNTPRNESDIMTQAATVLCDSLSIHIPLVFGLGRFSKKPTMEASPSRWWLFDAHPRDGQHYHTAVGFYLLNASALSFGVTEPPGYAHADPEA
jgi:hypothetical protein